MGCDCCELDTPERYAKCMELDAALKKKHKTRISLCGGTEIGYVPGPDSYGGSNITPPAKKRKKVKKAKPVKKKKRK